MRKYRWPGILLVLLVLFLVSALMYAEIPALRKLQHKAPAQLVFYNWSEQMPQEVLDAFQAETGIMVEYVTYDSAEEAFTNITSRKVAFDVAIIDNDYLHDLIAGGHLAKIDYSQVENFKNISANFRDLAFDPGNRYSVPNSWGTTGILVRSDLVDPPVTHWADLWEPRFAGKIAIRPQELEIIGVALKSLGYSVNSEDPEQLQAALQRLLDLQPGLHYVDTDTDSALPPLLSGEVQILIGWAEDGVQARLQNPAVQYVLPEDGGLLWGDSYIISSYSANRENAHRFINFLLRPKISAEIVNVYSYASANETALNFIEPVIANDPIVYPPVGRLEKCEWFLPLSSQAVDLRDALWARFMENVP